MRYEGTVYRPPSEANSLLIQATIGCPHNRCTFCGMYKNKKFRVRPLQEIKEDLLSALEYYGPGVRSLFFPDGNTIVMKTADLVEAIEYAHRLFPRLERVTVYGSARFLVRKPLKDLKLLREAGLNRIHSGMESGDDVVLEKIQKGASAAEIIAAGLRVKEAGIEISQYMLLGIGGVERWQEHARESARVLSAIDPHFIRLRTYTPVPRTPLGQEYLKGDFKLPSPHGILWELRLFIENLEGSGWLLSDHISNYVNVNGQLPHDREAMLALVDKALSIDESYFQQHDYRYL
ncbi:MAG: radical SAM protein [Syntrophomonadaceae bacterium]|nr:radical SAM protein [Syntrophomonadaceae bacterium]